MIVNLFLVFTTIAVLLSLIALLDFFLAYLLVLSIFDVLTYLFTRYGETTSVGFLSFVFYAGVLLAIYTLIICEHKDCIVQLNSFHNLQKIWQSSKEVPRQAVFYRHKNWEK